MVILNFPSILIIILKWHMIFGRKEIFSRIVSWHQTKPPNQSNYSPVITISLFPSYLLYNPLPNPYFILMLVSVLSIYDSQLWWKRKYQSIIIIIYGDLVLPHVEQPVPLNHIQPDPKRLKTPHQPHLPKFHLQPRPPQRYLKVRALQDPDAVLLRIHRLRPCLPRMEAQWELYLECWFWQETSCITIKDIDHWESYFLGTHLDVGPQHAQYDGAGGGPGV